MKKKLMNHVNELKQADNTECELFNLRKVTHHEVLGEIKTLRVDTSTGSD